ncbi:phosphate ABC transporter substrate-binding protein [Thiohalophilus thiocyanatoxydans]|uniref:Phosphate ABC transporter substrate-binding protein (PhoT family) n=1 Tax=Thiohalophilus thiocyanatoxydans TaxID=381308 RepID=A0A4R8IGG9_9GAMM|nr:phosphate ABC transporter substrate-binding protein [Thiohalophilus thiocyanatoxydans]TDX99671.1 phosphate ABC transporter substrate-binding protein (PhoT family) [Thiohalophilus thiocyanatoxydans]
MRRFQLLSVCALLVGLVAGAGADEAAADLNWAGCGITKKAFMAELAKAYEAKTGINIGIAGGGATKGIRNAAAGNIDIGGACRTSLESRDDERNAHQIPVAWDALVVVTHNDNPVDNITFEQLKELYLGKITNWKELGGNDAPIELYARRGKLSGVGRTLRELVFNNFNQEFETDNLMKSSGPVESAVEKNPHAIAVTGISSAKKRDFKILKLNDFEPSYEHIKTGEYVLYRPLYLVTQRGASDQKVKDFIRYAVSEEGQKIIRQQGTVPYTEAMALVMKQLDQYDKATKSGVYQTGAGSNI